MEGQLPAKLVQLEKRLIPIVLSSSAKLLNLENKVKGFLIITMADKKKTFMNVLIPILNLFYPTSIGIIYTNITIVRKKVQCQLPIL